MVILIKIIISALAITVITEVAKKCSLVGGLIVAMPINFLISVIWLYLEKKDLPLLVNFTSSALIGLIPTFLFILSFLFLLKKEVPVALSLSITIGLAGMFTGLFLYNRIIG